MLIFLQHVQKKSVPQTQVKRKKRFSSSYLPLIMSAIIMGFVIDGIFGNFITSVGSKGVDGDVGDVGVTIDGDVVFTCKYSFFKSLNFQ